MIFEILNELLPANPADPNFFDIIMQKPWKDPVPAVIFIWIPLALLVTSGVSKVCSKIRAR